MRNNVRLREFSAETLLQVSNLIDRRTLKIRTNPPETRTAEQKAELENLLAFQTQVIYAAQIVAREQKVMNQ